MPGLAFHQDDPIDRGDPGPSDATVGNGGGEGFGAVLREFHVPWPACDENRAREAAAAWNALADAIDDVTGQCNTAVSSITQNNAGKAIESFGTSWQQYGGPNGTLPVSSATCRALADSCSQLADHVAEAKAQIEHRAEELVAAIAAAVIVLVFTWGWSIAVSAAAGEAFAVWVTELMANLAGQIDAFTGLTDLAGLTEAASGTVGAIAEGTAAGAVSGAMRGALTAALQRGFDNELDAFNGEPAADPGDQVAEAGSEVGISVLLGVLSEGGASAAGALATSSTASEAYLQALDFSPELANSIAASAKIAGMLDSPAGKAFLAAGGITALHIRGVLSETEVTARSVETALEAMMEQAGESD